MHLPRTLEFDFWLHTCSFLVGYCETILVLYVSEPWKGMVMPPSCMEHWDKHWRAPRSWCHSTHEILVPYTYFVTLLHCWHHQSPQSSREAAFWGDLYSKAHWLQVPALLLAPRWLPRNRTWQGCARWLLLQVTQLVAQHGCPGAVPNARHDISLQIASTGCYLNLQVPLEYWKFFFSLVPTAHSALLAGYSACHYNIFYFLPSLIPVNPLTISCLSSPVFDTDVRGAMLTSRKEQNETTF